MNTTPLSLRLVPSPWSVAAALLIFAAAGGLKWNSGLMPVRVSVPMPAMPSPNARDNYNRAEALLRDEKNAASAADISPGFSQPGGFGLADKRRLVAENLPALALLRQGLRHAYLQPPDRSFSATHPHYAHDRAMAGLLRLQGQTRAAAGDWAGAINADVDAIQLGGSLQRGATIVGALVGTVCERTGRADAWEAVDHLTSAQAEAAARRLARVAAGTSPPADTLTSEKEYMQASLLQIFQEHGWRAAFAGMSDESYKRNIRAYLESPRVAYDSYTDYMTEAAGRANLPWPRQRALPPQIAPSDPVCSVLFPVFTASQVRQRDSAALNDILTAALALRAYKLDHGAYPPTLVALVPAYLPAVPLDPFSDGQPLRYALRSGRPLLYSIGPDAVDDGGQPIKTTRAQQANHMQYDERSRGDLIAGRE